MEHTPPSSRVRISSNFSKPTSEVPPESASRLRISKDFTKASAEQSPPSPERRSRLGGTLIEAARQKEQNEERTAKLEAWRTVLVPGECRIALDQGAEKITATRSGFTVDVTELLAEGQPITYRRPEEPEMGDVEGKVHHLIPASEDLPARVSVEYVGNGARKTIPFDVLMAPDPANGRFWEIPSPTE